MKKTSLALIGIVVLLVQSASAQVLFTTYEDFVMWQSANGFTAGAVTGPDSDGTVINGLGNTNAFGQVGTGGSLAVQYPQTSGPYNYPAGSPGEQGFTNFIAALEQPRKVLTFDYTTPPVGPTALTNGLFFQVGITVNCQGRFDQLLPSFTTALGGGWTRATFDWSSEAALIATQEVVNLAASTNSPPIPFTYFQLLMIYNSNYNPLQPYYLDNFVLRDPTAPVKLYTTTNDFAGWTTEAGFSNVGSTNFDLDGSVTNGLGNTTAAGAPGGAGALQIQHASTNNYAVASFGPQETNNAAFITALQHASLLTFDYTTPPAGTGTFFQVRIVVDCQGRFDQLEPSGTTAVSNGITRASIDWSSEAQALINQQAANTNSFSYFRIGIIWNSDYDSGTTPFQVDNISVITNSPSAYLIPASSKIVSESCTSTNGAIDPGETVTVNFVLQNTGNNSVSNVVATLLASGGVTAPSGSQSYGTLLANGGAATNSFTFTANGTCGGSLIATLQIQTNSVFFRNVPYVLTLGTLGAPATNNYSSGGISVAIPDFDTNGIVSSLTVGATGVVAHVAVRVRMNHTFDGDVAMDLVHPDGTTVSLIALDPGETAANYGTGATDCTGTFTVFDDSAATPIAAGSGPFAGSFIPRLPLAALNGRLSQGTWKLVVRDLAPGDTGTLYCWQLDVAYQTLICCSGSPPTDPFTTWQNQYFGCTGCTQAQGGADPDGDGMKNTNEFLAGFVPNNNAAYVHVISVVKTNTDMRITYLGANGNSTTTPPSTSRTNVLEFTTGTANGSYSNNFVSANVTNILSGGTGVGVVTNMVNPGGATGTSRYYRIRVLVP